jgi:hypothetical protein
VFAEVGYSTRMKRAFFLMLVLLLVGAAWAEKKKPTPQPTLLARPNQAVDIRGLKVPEPAQKCENFGWAAGLELMLRLQGVKLDQKYWITKIEGGELCQEQLRRMDELAQAVDGEYQLDSGPKVRLKTTYTQGAPAVLDEMIVAIREGSPWLLVWKGHPYLVDGLLYDEYIGPNNARIFMVREIKLLDPLVAQDDARRQVTFVRGRDNLADVDGTMMVRATPVE